MSNLHSNTESKNTPEMHDNNQQLLHRPAAPSQLLHSFIYPLWHDHQCTEQSREKRVVRARARIIFGFNGNKNTTTNQSPAPTTRAPLLLDDDGDEATRGLKRQWSIDRLLHAAPPHRQRTEGMKEGIEQKNDQATTISFCGQNKHRFQLQ